MHSDMYSVETGADRKRIDQNEWESGTDSPGLSHNKIFIHDIDTKFLSVPIICNGNLLCGSLLSFGF